MGLWETLDVEGPQSASAIFDDIEVMDIAPAVTLSEIILLPLKYVFKVLFNSFAVIFFV